MPTLEEVQALRERIANEIPAELACVQDEMPGWEKEGGNKHEEPPSSSEPFFVLLACGAAVGVVCTTPGVWHNIVW